MYDVNQCNFTGRLTRDPELKTTPSGSVVLSCSIAVNGNYKSSTGAVVEQVEFVNITIWNKPAEIMAQYGKKGSRVYISGAYKSRKWKGQDGIERTSIEINVKDFVLLDSKKDSQGQPVKHTSTQMSQAEIQEPEEEEINIEDIPF